jgi:predicted nucleic acid-binding protein
LKYVLDTNILVAVLKANVRVIGGALAGRSAFSERACYR